VVEVLPGTQFKVELDNGHEIQAYPCGKMRKHCIRLLPGDRVRVEISPHNPTRGQVVYRYKRARVWMKKARR
jgi:translation initiation factor IF-1